MLEVNPKFDVPAARLRIAAVTPFTSIDYPGKLSAVVFVRGCPWKCVYCQNPWMQDRRPQEGDSDWSRVIDLLKRRQGLLDGV
ncbi:MAG: anaerobic ribonucleoside-triphosphate reductase activating protein, partial [Sutterellaceae bacterium]|nr:anaerobic ribonucleoside-triphosphate reductase activating protein [Sutterellaceae bacterium]